MKSVCIYFGGIILFMTTFSCQKDIEIKLPPSSEPQLFIEGILFPGKKPQIYISSTVPFFEVKGTPQEVFARGAVVNLSDGVNTELLKADSAFDKFRCRWNLFYQGENLVERGKTYELEVTYRNQTYTATTHTRQQVVQISHVEYTAEFYDIYGGHDGVIITFDDAPEPGNFYRFQMNRTIDNSINHAHVLEVVPRTCAIGETYLVSDYGRNIFSDTLVNGKTFTINAEVSFEYHTGDTAWVFIQSIDRNSAEFYQQLDDQLQSILNPFVEPVFVQSKIEGEGVIGVFGSAILSDSVMIIYPQDSP